MNAKVDFREENAYIAFERKLRKALKDNNLAELLQLKIVDFSIYGDKHFKRYPLITDSSVLENSNSYYKDYLPNLGEGTRAFRYTTPNKEDKRNGLIYLPQCLTVKQQIFWSHHILNDLLYPLNRMPA